jgi:putative endonuclease
LLAERHGTERQLLDRGGMDLPAWLRSLLLPLPARFAALARRVPPELPSAADVGRRGEAAAAGYLRRQGLRIVARNFRARSGELDLVALDGDALVFIEVKSTLSGSRDPFERIGPAKARRVRRAAALYRRAAGACSLAARIDGVVVRFSRGAFGRMVPSEIRWYPSLYPMEDGR